MNKDVLRYSTPVTSQHKLYANRAKLRADLQFLCRRF